MKEEEKRLEIKKRKKGSTPKFFKRGLTKKR